MFSPFLIALFFMIFGVLNFRSRQSIITAMYEKNIPFARFMFYFGVIFQLLLGAAIMIDMYTSFAAIGLIIFDIVAIFIFHPFWKMTGELRRLNQIIFITNSTIVIGALLLLIDLTIFGEGLSWLKFIKSVCYPHF